MSEPGPHPEPKRVLITGISGAHAQLIATRLFDRGHTVFGIDRRPCPTLPKGIHVYQADIRKRPAADVFRSRKPEVVVHMATTTHYSSSRQERLRINLHGTRTIFELCHTHGVKQAVFLGRHTIYGAAPDAPLFRTEDEPPLAVTTFPELADLVAADLYAGTALWRFPSLGTAVLRLVYTLGPVHSSTLANFLRGPRVPMLMGFDPLFHFLHDYDAADAIVAAIEHNVRGVFNVCGPPPVPLSTLCRATGRSTIPIPAGLFHRVNGHFGLSRLPRGAASHLAHPVVVDGQAFTNATGFKYRYDADAAMKAFRTSSPA
ncbi:MAG: NAD-dependent epimerase/dehydratase family protein [Nannocystaceae bacterium]